MPNLKRPLTNTSIHPAWHPAPPVCLLPRLLPLPLPLPLFLTALPYILLHEPQRPKPTLRHHRACILRTMPTDVPGRRTRAAYFGSVVAVLAEGAVGAAAGVRIEARGSGGDAGGGGGSSSSDGIGV